MKTLTELQNENREVENSLYLFCYGNNGLNILHKELNALRMVIKYNNDVEDLALKLTLERAEKTLVDSIECIELAYKRAKELTT